MAHIIKSNWSVEVERYEWISALPFGTVLDALHGGLGRPDFFGFDARIDAIRDWGDYRSEVGRAAGSSGLIVFLELDIGSVIQRDPDAAVYRAVRIIAGNPVTMESMTRTSPAIGALAPVTILLFESAAGVHVRYDSVVSAAGAEITSVAETIATELDRAVFALIESAAGADTELNAAEIR